MTDMVSLTDPRTLQAPGIVALANVEDRKSPVAYGYDEKLYVYFREGSILGVSTGLGGGGFGGGGGAPGAAPAGRASGRGTATDPDVLQGRQFVPPERPTRRTPAEQELYVPDELQDLARTTLPERSQWPRVIVRFAPEHDLLLSGLLVGGGEVGEKPALVDAPHGKGHVLLFGFNPMWRDETGGSYFFLLNALMNWDHLDAGRSAPARPGATTGAEE